MSPRRSDWILLCAVFCFWSGLATVRAQETQPAKSEPVPSVVPDKPAAPKGPSEVVPLKSANGETGTLLRTPLLDEILAELAARRQKQPQEPLAWSVTGISLQGTADGDQAVLQATLRIQLLVDGKWIRVPLKLTEGTLQDQSYTGPGEATSGGIDPDLGYLWWLKGKGQHVLKFNLIVPLRKDLPARRLQLSLPPTVVSELKLRVPFPRITAKADELGRATLNVAATGDGATNIDMVGLGPQVDVTWQPQPDLGTVETVLEARTAITATVDGRTLLLRANQRLGALQGSFSQVQVRLPRGGELVKIEGDLYKERTVDPMDPSLVTVILKESVTSATPVDLKWSVTVDIPPMSERILIDGFEVAKAKIQTGHLAVRVVGDYRLERIEDQNQFVQRDNLSTLEKAVPAFPSREDVSSAYAILRQPFQLAFNLQSEKAHVTVKPRLFLSLNAERMELFAEYDIQVYRWGIEDVKFLWPGWKEEGWKLDPVTPSNLVEETKLDGKDEIQVKLIERQVGPVVGGADRSSTVPRQFTLLLHGTRPLPAGQAALPFTLPAMSGANLIPADLVVVMADNLDADLRPLAETAARLQTVPQSDAIKLPANLVDLRRRDYRLDASAARFSVATTLQKRQINAQTEVDLSLDGSELAWEQRIAFDVNYDRLSQILLAVPDKLVGRASYRLVSTATSTEAGAKPITLVPISTGAVEGSRVQQRLALDAPRIGKFDVIIEATLPVTWPIGSITADLELPLVLSADADFSATRARIRKPKRQQLALAAEGWMPLAPQNGASVWLAPANLTAVKVTCSQTDGSGQQGIAVPRRFVQAVLTPLKEVYCQAQYYLPDPPSVVRVTFPNRSTPTSIRWGQTRLPTASVVQTPGTPDRYQLTLPDPESNSNEHVLTIVYQLPPQSPLGIGAERKLEVPEIESDGTPTQTFWEVQLPVNQHLWMSPIGFTNEYDWRRTGGWWSRVPRMSAGELELWLRNRPLSDGTPPSAIVGNRYLFSSVHGSPVMIFRTLSAPLIVLIGASLALVFGFVLVNVPATRHVLTFLWVGFLTTLIGLWYPEPVLVLLQPAGLGLILAVLASVAQRWFRRSRSQPVLTLTSPSDVLAATSSREQAIPAGFAMNSDEPTYSQQAAYPVPDGGIGL